MRCYKYIIAMNNEYMNYKKKYIYCTIKLVRKMHLKSDSALLILH